jgi:3-hydroxybutyrate dehydrogenase
MVEGLPGRLGAIDILVNNAVVGHFTPVEAFAPEHWEEAHLVNLTAPFHLIHLAQPSMRQRNWGRIVNLASIYSTRAAENRIDYVTTKTAIPDKTRAVALETATTGITCNVICPVCCRRQPSSRRSLASPRSTIFQSNKPPATISPRGSPRDGSPRWRASARCRCSCAAPPRRQDITGATLPIDGG